MASWFRWYHGCVSDPKLGVVAKNCKQPKYLVIAVWAALLEMASQASERGDVTGFEADDFAEAVGANTEAVQAIFDAMATKGLISENRVVAWDKRQFEGEGAERQKRYRERKKHNVTGSDVTVTQRNVTVTTEQTQIQNRTDKDKSEKDLDWGGSGIPAAALKPRFDRVKGGAQRFAGLGERPFKPKNPAKADADMVTHLTTHCGMDAGEAWTVVAAARDPTHEKHSVMARYCESESRDNKLGWFHLEAAE